MLIKDNLVLTRPEPKGSGGLEFLYRVNGYGVSALSRPMENAMKVHWEVEVIKFKDSQTLNYEVCYTTELADNTLVFHNDGSLNRFLIKACDYFKEISILEGMLEE